MRTWKFLLICAVVAALYVPASASAAFMHVVAPGESLYSVAAADGMSVDQLAAANGFSPNTPLIAGSTIAIPPQGAAGGSGNMTSDSQSAAGTPSGSSASYASTDSSAVPASSSSPASSGGYTVQPGDTLTSIAARYGVSVNQLAAANGLDPAGLLIAGTSISVSGSPTASSASSSGTTEDVSTTPTTTSTATAAGGSGPQPTSEVVTPSEVASIASANGVSPALAEAIGYQESGFNNAEVSPTGAVGVMQIEPGTWNFIGQNLATPPPLATDSAADNVRGGVLLLHHLLDQSGGDPAMAAAGYYQGMDSVRAHGVYSSTQQYVNDVMSLYQRFGGG